MRHLPILAAALALVACAGSVEPPPTLVVLVRHAEKAAEPVEDPGLTGAGQARAAALAAALDGASLDRVLTTPFRRTRDTAAPAAARFGVEPQVVGVAGDVDAHARAVADAVRGRPGETILVVGHSNTIPRIVRALGGPALDDLAEDEYATLFLLELRAGVPPKLVRSRYGDADASAAGAREDDR